MRPRKDRITNPPQATAYVVDGSTVIVAGDVAYVQRPGHQPYAVHVPTACAALAKLARARD